MIRDITKNKSTYTVLAIFGSLFVMYFLKERNNPSHLFVATAVFSLCYLIWGFWHHARSKSLTGAIVLEYFLVAVLGLVIVSSLLL